MALASGTKLGSYEIQSPLGAGGMGEVYRATDTKLGRDVALKVLPAEMARDPERLGRFRREAKALAQLDHPNIVTIHSVEECDGIYFLTMQLVEGQPLDRLICAGGLPLEQIVEIACALGDALAAAHEKGIIHRDLKPANVMISNEGRVKVLDFGLAKDVRSSNLGDATMTSASRTEMGVVMGTPAYMSPEQTSGRPLDHRTDIFSLGVVLHEMATGRRPFEGGSSAELVSAILRDTPPSITDMRPDMPSDLARIVRRCLEKDPRHRLQTARDVSNEFRDMARTASRPTSVSSVASRMAPPSDSGAVRGAEGFWVAVLPFKYTGSNADVSAMAEGLTDDVVTGLSRFSYLRVAARSSTAQYARAAVDARAAAKELDARYVMEGSIRPAGTKVRIAVQLVDAATGTALWAEAYDRPFTPEAMLDLLDELVPRIVSTVADMNGVLPRSMGGALRGRPSEQLSPYEAVLRSFSYCELGTPEELAAARSALVLAVKKAPGYSDAWAMLAFLHCQDYVHGFNLQPDCLAAGAEAGRRAVEAGPSSHLAYFSLAQALFMQKQYQAFRNAAERTVALNPMDGNSIALIGELVTYTGDEERGMELAQRAKQLNPNHPGWYWYTDFYHAYRHGDYREALGFALKANMPSHYAMYMLTAAAYGQLGEHENAAKAVRELLRLRHDFASIVLWQTKKVWEPEYGERFLEGLRKAGLSITDGTAEPAEATSTAKVTESAATRPDEGFWVAVLPFKYSGTSAELKALADGLSEEIVTGLSRFSYLKVIARGSTAKYSSESGDARTISKQLGARYLMEGSIRQAGTKLRLAVQLVDAVSGVQMWAETYERAFSAEAIFEVQDELVLRIVSTVADQHGVLPHSMSNLIRNKPDDQLSPHEAVLRVFSFHERMSPEEHASVRALLEQAVRNAPSDGDCWAMLATLYADEYMFGFSGGPDPLGRAQEAAQRAVELAPSSSLASQALAQSLFFRREWQVFRPVAERTVALNRADGALNAFIGMLIALAGEWERGCAVVDAAIQLNPHHPGWYWLMSVFNTYRNRDYRASAAAALRINMPGYFWGPATSAAALGQLGEHARAQKALKELLVIRPDFGRTARQEFGKWFDDELAEHYVEGIRKAGLQVVDGVEASDAVQATASGAARADEGFWVAVLPFKCIGNNADLMALAEGLTEDVVTGLSRFSYLRVIARSSTSRYANQAVDIRSAGNELGARYVIEGSLRQAGTKLRLAVQLVDTVSGAHLWAENYERRFSPENLFELQDDLVPRIVSTAADQHGVLPRRISEELLVKNEEDLTPHEAVLRSFSFLQRITPIEHATARRILERAVERAPNQADAWAMLAIMYDTEFADEYNLRPNPLERAITAAQRAVDLAPTHALGYYALAFTYFFRKDNAGFRAAVEQAIKLNPMDGSVMGLLGLLVHHVGEMERGTQMVEAAMQLNPHYPPVFRAPAFLNAYAEGKYAEALELAVRFNMPGFFHAHAMRAAALGQLGQREAAQQAVQELLAVRPDFAVTARRDYGKWWDAKTVDHLVEGLRQAGLEIPDTDSKPAPSDAHAGC